MLPRARKAKARGRAPRFRQLVTERLEDRSLLALAAYQIHLLPPGGPITGPDLTTVKVGESYDLAVSVRDLRETPLGVFSGYLDIGYDSSKTRVRVAEVQRISIGPFDTSSAGGASGSFALSFGDQTTADIAFSPNAAALATAVESALAALVGVGAGNVGVGVDVLNNNSTMLLQVRFPGKFYDLDAANLVVASQNITGPSNPQVATSYEGDLQAGSNPFAFKEAFRSREPLSVYANGVSALDQPNLLDEVGAFSSLFPLTGSEARELVRARLIATAAGSVTFAPDFEHLELPESHTLMYGIGPSIAPADIDPGAARTLTIITPNVAPSFVKGADQTTTDEAGPQSVAGWATSILAGPPAEASQSLTFEVTTTNSALFATPPAIDASGKLTFTPALNAEGTAQVTVVLRDSGGTEHGGVDVSAAQAFAIQIEKLRPLHNAALPLDASGDGSIVADDALECINYINAFGAIEIDKIPLATKKFLDVDADGHLSPGDPLMVINYINAFGPMIKAPGDGDGEGEGPGQSDDFSSLLGLLAQDAAKQATRRRRS